LVLPQVVEPTGCPGRVVTASTEEPQISGRVSPTNTCRSRPRNVAGSSRPLSSVGPCLVGHVRPTHPRPFARTVLPQIVELSAVPGRVQTNPTPEPQIS